MIKTKCKISLYGKKWNTKCFIMIPWIIHRWIESWWNWPEICDKYWRTAIHFDYPTDVYEDSIILNDITEFLQNNTYENIIICGLSFWAIPAMQLIQDLPSTILTKVVYLVSVCGVPTYDSLSQEKQNSIVKIMKYKNNIKIASKYLLKIVRNIDVFFWGKRIGWNFYTKRQWLPEQVKKKIIKAASMWLVPGLLGRAEKIFHTRDIPILPVSTIAIYAPHDPFYIDPTYAAQIIIDNSTENAFLIEANPWWHASIVEIPETYDVILENILGQLW